MSSAWVAVILVLVSGQPAQPNTPPPTGEEEGGAAGTDEGEDSEITKLFLDSVLLRLAQEGNAEGLEHFRAGSYPEALTAFLESHALDPNDPEITNNLAFTYDELGNTERAEQYYRLTLTLDPKRVVAYLNLADLLMEGGRADRMVEAGELLVRARELSGNRRGVLLRQARTAARQEQFDTAERLYLEASTAVDLDGAELSAPEQAARHQHFQLEVGDFYRRFGRSEEAQRWYEKVARAGGAEGEERIRQLEVEEEARRFGWTRRTIETSARARALTERARGHVDQLRFDEAQSVLREAIRIAPDFSDARALLGDILRREGRIEAAELVYLRALALDQGSVELHARLAEIYLSQQERAAEAVALLERAVQIGPDYKGLQLQLARAYRSSGDLPRALRAVDEYLTRAPQGEERWQAQVLRAALRTLLHQVGTEVTELPAATAGQGELWVAYNRVRALLARGETDAAMAELRRAAAEQATPALRNLEARILHGTGRLTEAAATYAESLEADPDQPVVYTELGLLRESMGEPDTAAVHYLAAADLGHAEGTYHLARLGLTTYRRGSWIDRLVGVAELWRARERMQSFVTQRPDSMYADDARALLEEMYAELTKLGAAFAGLLGLLLVGLISTLRTYHGGVTLETLLRQHPEAGPEVQRVLSAIRHEVLKHNTMVLSGLVAAIERGDDVGDKGAHVCRSLLGDGDGESVWRRLQQYADQLAQIGRSYELRLNLRRKDPALSALLGGFRLLQSLSRDLRRVSTLGRRRRRRLLIGLRHAARMLNTDGYEAVRALLDQLRAVTVDEALLHGIFDRTRREPGLVELRLAPLELDVGVELPCGVCVPRTDFEDILGNLMRNAIQSSARLETSGEADEIRIGLAVGSEVNPITGHERLLFGVRDRSPRELVATDLRGRDIEGGLGLTAELVSRYDGSIDLDTDVEGWSKAVVVKLPRGEPSTAE